MKKIYRMAVIGKDVSKSDSARMHTFDMEGLGSGCTFDLLSVAKEDFDAYAKKLLAEYDAFCVTIPYKLDIIPYLNGMEGDAETFGAVNVVKGGRGYNTDGVGFMLMLENGGIRPAGKKVLVLGAGGAGRSVIKKLADAGADVYAYDLRAQNLEDVYAEFGCFTPLKELKPADYDIVINVTGVGMHKTEGVSPVGEDLLSRAGAAIDLIYYPRKSEFLRIAEVWASPSSTGRGCSSIRHITETASCSRSSPTPPRQSGCLRHISGNIQTERPPAGGKYTAKERSE